MMDPPAERIPGRVLAVDYGRRRIGVAASDPLRILAKPRDTISAGSPSAEPTPELLDLIRGLEPTVIVIGIPRNMDGSEGEMALEAREFGRRLGIACGVPVAERDERLSTIEAERMIRELGLPKRKRERRGLRDMMAAVVLLEDYLREDANS